MSLPGAPSRWERLPQWLRPRAAELPGSGQMRLIETTLLVLAAVFLAVATVNDLGREVDINHRLIADLATWRAYTHHDYLNISIDRETLGLGSGREILCGNTEPGGPGERTQICLAIWGPVRHGQRTVHGGWYLPRYHPDLRAYRYGCFGAAGQGKCPR